MRRVYGRNSWNGERAVTIPARSGCTEQSGCIEDVREIFGLWRAASFGSHPFLEIIYKSHCTIGLLVLSTEKTIIIDPAEGLEKRQDKVQGKT
ncbi:hypothetical protein [Paenibacillus elgii]|uniref:hypothetical protein n=1 Tax=Paenibacillus elgii TaxID=189691 RepID=UPI00196815A7|nr:hypothetical protein [Paenibacillus elgii]